MPNFARLARAVYDQSMDTSRPCLRDKNNNPYTRHGILARVFIVICVVLFLVTGFFALVMLLNPDLDHRQGILMLVVSLFFLTSAFLVKGRRFTLTDESFLYGKQSISLSELKESLRVQPPLRSMSRVELPINGKLVHYSLQTYVRAESFTSQLEKRLGYQLPFSKARIAKSQIPRIVTILSFLVAIFALLIWISP